MSLRLLRVCELIKRELGSIIGREMRFSAPLVSVRAVDITPDLKQAHVFISAIGTKRQKEEAILELTVKRQHLQQELARRIILKYTPHLHFELDESIERGTRVLNLLDEIVPTLPQDEEDGGYKAGEEGADDLESGDRPGEGEAPR